MSRRLVPPKPVILRPAEQLRGRNRQKNFGIPTIPDPNGNSLIHRYKTRQMHLRQLRVALLLVPASMTWIVELCRPGLQLLGKELLLHQPLRRVAKLYDSILKNR